MGIAAELKESFNCPKMVTVHWDVRIMKLKGNIKSNQVCVYLSGVQADQTRKLSGVPQTPSGTGEAEATIVKELLLNWEVQKEVVGLVFDTTSRNPRAQNVA